MQPKERRKIKTHLQTEGNLALADESLGVFQEPKQKTCLRLVEDISKEDNSVILAKEIIAVAGMSLLLCIMWFIIILVIYRIVV